MTRTTETRKESEMQIRYKTACDGGASSKIDGKYIDHDGYLLKLTRTDGWVEVRCLTPTETEAIKAVGEKFWEGQNWPVTPGRTVEAELRSDGSLVFLTDEPGQPKPHVEDEIAVHESRLEKACEDGYMGGAMPADA